MTSLPLQRAFVALGSNLAEPQTQLIRAFDALGALPNTHLSARSSLYRSAALGFAAQPDFINAVAALETGLAPHDLLQSLLAIEQTFGRVREFRNAPRILDLDLLLYGDQSLHETGLTLPHPRMHERAFVLAPLLEIDPDCRIPGKGEAKSWLARCGEQAILRLA